MEISNIKSRSIQWAGCAHLLAMTSLIFLFWIHKFLWVFLFTHVQTWMCFCLQNSAPSTTLLRHVSRVWIFRHDLIVSEGLGAWLSCFRQSSGHDTVCQIDCLLPKRAILRSISSTFNTQTDLQRRDLPTPELPRRQKWKDQRWCGVGGEICN